MSQCLYNLNTIFNLRFFSQIIVMINEWFFETDKLCSPNQNDQNVQLGVYLNYDKNTFCKFRVSNSQKSNIVQEGVAVSGQAKTPQKPENVILMSFFLTISDDSFI